MCWCWTNPPITWTCRPPRAGAHAGGVSRHGAAGQRHDQAFVRHTATRLLFLQEGRAQVFNGTLDAWEEEKRASPPQADAALRRALQMRMTELIGRISRRGEAQLEQAYDACLANSGPALVAAPL